MEVSAQDRDHGRNQTMRFSLGTTRLPLTARMTQEASVSAVVDVVDTRHPAAAVDILHQVAVGEVAAARLTWGRRCSQHQAVVMAAVAVTAAVVAVTVAVVT